MRDQHALHARSDRPEAILAELDAHADRAVRARVREAVAHLMEIHREVLARALELASDDALGGVALTTRLADDAVDEGAGGGRFRAVPERYLRLPDRALAGAPWENLQVPVGSAFFFRHSGTGRVTALSEPGGRH
jgi:hypothetical protein